MFEQILSSLDGLTDLERADVLRVLMSKDSRLSKVKALLGITTTDQDDVLEFVIQTVEDMILSYINQDTLPPRLENVLIVMCVSYYKSAGLGTTTAAVGPVASVKRGDVQTSFATGSGSSGSANTFNLGTDSGDFFGWKTVLNEYRVLTANFSAVFRPTLHKPTGRLTPPLPFGRKSAIRRKNGRPGPSRSAHMTPTTAATKCPTTGNTGHLTSTRTSGNLASMAGRR